MKRVNFASIDWWLLIPVVILLVFSLVTLYTISTELFRSQLIFIIFSSIVFFGLSRLNPSVLRYYSIPIYLGSLIILAAVLVFGVETRGTVRWIEIFGVRIQFSEILKPFLALALASYLANLKNYSFKSFVSVIILLLPLFVLIFRQPDLGNAAIYGIVTILALLIYGFPYKWFFVGFLLFLSSIPFLWVTLHEYQKQRVLTFLDPDKDPLGASYNAIQAVIAIGSGMIIGKGLGQGTQVSLNFLPEQHTDFIFATISEELGFMGALVIIACFAVILYRLYQIIKSSEDKFSRIFSVLVFLIIFVHFTVNVGMNLAILPIVGITLPLVSYGGSSLLSIFILFGLLFAVNNKSRTKVLEIR